MLKKKYDFAFSLGCTCTCSDSLRRCGFQFASYPFDWAGTGNVVKNAKILIDRFAGFMKKENLVANGAGNDGATNIYVDRATDFWFVHDFPQKKSFDDGFAETKAKFDRRIARLLANIESAKSILVVGVEIPGYPSPSRDELARVQMELCRTFPQRDIDFLYFAHRNEQRFDPKELETVAEHVFRSFLDLRLPGAENPYIANRAVVIPALKKLVRHVEDRRSPAGKSAFRRQRKEQRYARVRAKGLWSFLVNSFECRMYRHFRNRLEKKGFPVPQWRAGFES